MSHDETKLGVAPSAKFEEGQEDTLISVFHDFGEMVATEGTITKNTDYYACISRAEVEVNDAQLF